MNAKYILVVAVLTASALSGWTQQPPPGDDVTVGEFAPPMPQGGPHPNQPGVPGRDPLADNFFPPELVMHNQGVLRLSDEQKNTIKEALQKSMSQVTGLQWQQSEEREKMTALLKQERVEEAPVLAQFDKLQAIENDIKRQHLGLLLKIRSTLTPDQQAKLRELKARALPPMVMEGRIGVGERHGPMGGLQGRSGAVALPSCRPAGP